MSSKKLNIAQIHWGFPPIIGGVETHLALIMPEMVRIGHKVTLLTGSCEGAPQEEEFEGANIFRTPLMDLNWLFKRGLQGLDDELTHIFSRYIDENKPDILHAHNMHYFSKPHATILSDLAKKNGIPLVLSAHNVWDDILFLELTRKISWDHIIAVSHYIKKELLGTGCDDINVTVLHHGIDTRKFHPGIKADKVYKRYPQLRGRKVLFHPARMGMAKGCDVTIKAFRIIKEHHPDAFLVLAGTKNIIDWGATQQKDIAYFVSLINYFGLKESVLVDSYLLKDMPMMYQASDVITYPSSVSEPFGMTMLEAMAMEKPIIVTNMGGMPEIIRDGINGFVVHVKDFEALAARTSQLFSDEGMCKRLGRTGHAMVETSYTERHVTDTTIGVYNKLLGCSGHDYL